MAVRGTELDGELRLIFLGVTWGSGLLLAGHTQYSWANLQTDSVEACRICGRGAVCMACVAVMLCLSGGQLLQSCEVA
jgi:hypothetical protein